MNKRQWVTEHKNEHGKWVGCGCKITRMGVIRSPWEHRLREMQIQEITVTKREWV